MFLGTRRFWLWAGGLAALLGVSTQAECSNPAAGTFAVELDPITTALGARNILAYVEPPGLEHWTFAGIAIKAGFPEWMDDIMSYRNRKENFDSEIRLSPGFVIDYYFADGPRQAWHAGIFNFFFRYEVSRNGDAARFTNHVVMPRLGYRWFPSESKPIYIDPFGGLLLEYKVRGSNQVDGTAVKPTPLLPFASVHVGIHF